MNSPPKSALEELQELQILKKKAIRRAWIRGTLILAGLAMLTYYGKMRPHLPKVPIYGDLEMWIFPNGKDYSVYICFPHKSRINSDSALGERIFINPPLNWIFLDSNFLRYQKKNMYILAPPNGEIPLKNWCSQIESPDSLYLVGREGGRCAQSLVYQSGPLTKDAAVWVYLETRPNDSAFSLRLRFAGHQLEVLHGDFASTYFADDSLSLAIQLLHNARPISSLEIPAQILLQPGLATKEGKPESALILNKSREAIAIRLSHQGSIYLKKIVLRHTLNNEEMKRFP